MRSRPNTAWSLTTSTDKLWDSRQYDYMHLAVLMDLRDEMQRMRKVLECVNTQRIPRILDSIETATRATARNTTKPRRKRKAA